MTARRLVLAFFLLGLALLPTSPAHAQRKVAERFGATADVHVSILNIAGSVKVTGWEHDSVAISGVVNELPAQKFIVHRSEGGVKIGIWDPNVEKVAPSEFEVRVPSGAQVWVRTGSSSVFVTGVQGGIDVNSVGGEVEIRGAPREAFAESMTGTVVFDVNTQLARARSVTAAIRVHGRITDLTATSVSGNILIDGAAIERGSFETVDGELRFVGSFSPRANLSFVTHGGAVEFLIPASTDAAFRVNSYEGALVNEFKVPNRTTRSKIKGAENTFTLGRGGTQIDVRTFRGRVVVRSR